MTLKALLHLTKIYCDRYQVKLVGTKTKLLVFNTNKTKVQAKVELALTTISVDGDIITPITQATHVGVVWSGHQLVMVPTLLPGLQHAGDL